jgi:hypothetical protein
MAASPKFEKDHPFSQPPKRPRGSSIFTRHLERNLSVASCERIPIRVTHSPHGAKGSKHSFLLTMSSKQITCVSDVLATQAPLADPHLLGWQIRKNGANIESVLPSPLGTNLPRSPSVGLSGLWGILLQKSKLAGPRIFAKTRNGKRSPIRTTSIGLPKSPVSLTSGDEVPHNFT